MVNTSSLKSLTSIVHPAVSGSDIFCVHAVAAGVEHPPERNHVIFHNISGVNYGERCEGGKNDTERQLERRLTDAPALFSASDSHRKNAAAV